MIEIKSIFQGVSVLSFLLANPRQRFQLAIMRWSSIVSYTHDLNVFYFNLTYTFYDLFRHIYRRFLIRSRDNAQTKRKRHKNRLYTCHRIPIRNIAAIPKMLRADNAPKTLKTLQIVPTKILILQRIPQCKKMRTIDLN